MSTAPKPSAQASTLIIIAARSRSAQSGLSSQNHCGFEFKAGHFLELTWIDPPETDAEGNARAFSIASAPYEDRLMFTTRLRDTAFKRVLRDTPIGSIAKIDGPFGDLTLHNNVSRPGCPAGRRNWNHPVSQHDSPRRARKAAT